MTSPVSMVGQTCISTASSVPDKARMNNGVHSVTLSDGGNPYRHRDFHHGPWHSLAAAALQDMALEHVESANKPHVKETICHSGHMLPRCASLTCPLLVQVHVPVRVQLPGSSHDSKKGVLSFPSCSSPRPKLSHWLSVAYTSS